MVKLRPLSQRKVIMILEDNGFKNTRSRSHMTFKKKSTNQVLTTWVPHHKEVTVFVIKHIIRQTGKPQEEFK